MQILFYKGRRRDNPNSTIFDNLICLIDGGKYSHVEFIIPSVDENSQFIQTWGSHASRGGVSEGMYLRNSGEYDIVEIDDFYLKALYLNMGKITGGYNYLGLPGTKFDWWPRGKGKWFCSELLAACFCLNDYWTYGVDDIYWWLMYDHRAKAKLIEINR